MLVDSFNRRHDYLRISLTDRCNFRCTYCMPLDFPGAYKWSDRWMTPEEIVRIAEVFVRLGVTKIRLTGGEPLVRKDVGEVITGLSALPVQLTMTTNGVLLDEYMDVIKQAGIRSINVSLDSLHREKFHKITQRDKFDLVYRNIRSLLASSFHVKVNMVVMKGVNEDEIPAFVELTKSENLHVRFIEFMPFDDNQWDASKVVSEAEILESISSCYEIEKLKDGPHETARAWRAAGHKGTFALISTMTHPFCSGCNRLRLTADGKMKNCLFSKGEMDLLTPLRAGHDIDDLIRQQLWEKKAERGGQINGSLQDVQSGEIKNRAMISIGG